jgi:hypothetical protein
VTIRLWLYEYSFFHCIGLTRLLPSYAVARLEFACFLRGYSALNQGFRGPFCPVKGALRGLYNSLETVEYKASGLLLT